MTRNQILWLTTKPETATLLRALENAATMAVLTVGPVDVDFEVRYQQDGCRSVAVFLVEGRRSEE